MRPRSRLCRCPRPARAVDGDGAAFCENCEELLPSSEQEMLATLIVKVDKLARRVEAVAPDPDAPSVELIDVDEAARRLGVSRDYIYQHADELGAQRLGDGPKARLRFDPRRLVADSQPATNGDSRPRRSRARRATGAELLPIRGERRKRP